MTDSTAILVAQVEQVSPPPIDWGALTPLLVVLGAACVAGCLILQLGGLAWADRLAGAGTRR